MTSTLPRVLMIWPYGINGAESIPIWRELVEDKKIAPDYVVGRYDEVDWLANGRTRWDIDTIVTLYNLAAKSVKRVA